MPSLRGLEYQRQLITSGGVIPSLLTSPNMTRKEIINRLRLTAQRCGFEVIEGLDRNGKVKYFSLRATWEYEDGYRPSTIPSTPQEQYMYLLGFIAAKHQSI